MLWVYPECIQSGRESGALDGRNYGRCTAQIHCLLYATDEAAADDAFVDEPGANFQLSLGGQVGQSGASAGPAR